MSRPWMPLYPGDYLRDTQELTTLQHGMYLLLIMHYWQHEELPADDASLARISKTSLYQWKSNCLAIAKLFLPGWKHKRIERELEKYREISEKRAMSGRKGGLISRGKTNVERLVNQAFAKQTGPIPHKYITSTESVSARSSEEVLGENPSVVALRERLARAKKGR